MQLKELELSGFKSFAKKTTLSFTQPITAIVGPNGSGKSNVAEAFRFALGEQSIKSLRGKRGEDLIFSGTGKMPRGNKASVRVTFDNTNKLFSVDFPEVTIERTVYRDGVNEYAVNGSKVRLKDVHELLAHANIGQSGHHIISQGEADRILSSNPKERRQMIEEALGLRVYKYKKEEAEKKLSKTEENISNVESLRKEIAPHLRFLKKQVEKVERAKEIRDELVQKYQEYFAKEKAWLSYEEAQYAKESAEPKKRLAEIEEELKSLPKETVVDTSSLDAKIKEKEAERDKKDTEAQELLQKLGRSEGALEAAKRASGGDEKISIHAETFSEFRQKVLAAAESAERADSFTGLRQGLDTLLKVVRPFLDAYKGTAQKDTGNVELLQKEYEEAKHAYEQVSTEAQAIRASVRALYEERENARREGQEGQVKRLTLTAEEAKLSGIVRSLAERKERVRVEREEFEREHREAIAIVGEAAVRYQEGEVDEKRGDQEMRKREIERMKIRVEELGGGGEDIMREYKDVEERDAFLEKEIGDLLSSKEKLVGLIEELEKELTSTFNEGLVAINNAFNEFFVTMFGGGSARLIATTVERATEEEVEEESGVDVSISVPGKRVKGLMALSGGERALTSIALIFAMSQVNPPPFLILDETDAALDEANSKRYGDMIENLAKRSQLILITHNRETMSRAGVLYGVTMSGDGMSKLLSIQLEDAVQVAK